MKRIENPKEGGSAIVHDGYKHAKETKRVMDAVAAKLMGLPEGTSADNVVALWDGLRSISNAEAWRVKRTDSSMRILRTVNAEQENRAEMNRSG